MESHILEFIANYNAERDFSYIDANMDKTQNPPDVCRKAIFFHEQVALGIRELAYNVSLELLHDLYSIIAQYSASVWSYYPYFYEIGQALIQKGRTKYLFHYLKYARCSFDVLLNGGKAEWSDEVVLEIRAFLKEQQKIQTDENLLDDIDFGLKRRFGLYRIINGGLLEDEAERREWKESKKRIWTQIEEK